MLSKITEQAYRHGSLEGRMGQMGLTNREYEERYLGLRFMYVTGIVI